MNLEEYLTQLKDLSETPLPEAKVTKKIVKNSPRKRTRLKKKRFNTKKN